MSRVPEESAPDQRVDRDRSELLLDVGVPQPMRAMLFNSWPLILAALVLSYLAAMFFPAIGGLLLIGTPIAIVAALVAAGSRAKKIRLRVTDEMMSVSNGKGGFACDRSAVRSAVLVESLARRRFGIRTQSLILLDEQGRTAFMLNGLLWPPAVIDSVIRLMPGVPLERLEGKQSPETLAARYPNILKDTYGTESGPSMK